MSKNKRGFGSWKDVDDYVLGPISGPLTDLLEYLTPERKDRELIEKERLEKEAEEKYYEDIKKRRKARYEALKEKYKD